MLYFGIDPGFSGAIAAVTQDGKFYGVWDTPTIKVKIGKKIRSKYDVLLMAAILRARFRDIHSVGLEKVHAMPTQGVVSMFSMGTGFGVWLGVVGAVLSNLPILIEPRRWKAFYGLSKDKEQSRLLAIKKFPQACDKLSRKKDEGRAEAIFIADFTRRIRLENVGSN